MSAGGGRWPADIRLPGLPGILSHPADIAPVGLPTPPAPRASAPLPPPAAVPGKLHACRTGTRARHDMSEFGQDALVAADQAERALCERSLDAEVVVLPGRPNEFRWDHLL